LIFRINDIVLCDLFSLLKKIENNLNNLFDV
jgi:hypothetical protein